MPATRSLKEYKGRSKFGFLDGHLCRIMDSDPVGNRIMLYRFTDHERIVVALSDWKKKSGEAYTLKELCELINRSYYYTRRIVSEEMDGVGVYATYEPDKLDDPNTWRRWYFSKEDVLKVHQYMADLDPRGEGYHHKQKGRRNYPRPKNKLVKRHDMPTREQLLAKLNSDEIYYIQNDEGEYVPVFKPKW